MISYKTEDVLSAFRAQLQTRHDTSSRHIMNDEERSYRSWMPGISSDTLFILVIGVFKWACESHISTHQEVLSMAPEIMLCVGRWSMVTTNANQTSLFGPQYYFSNASRSTHSSQHSILSVLDIV